MKKLGIVFILMGLLQACASNRLKNENALSQVKKVAVIGFKAQLPAASSIGLLNGGLSGMKGGQMTAMTSPSTDLMLSNFVRILEKRQNWQVLNIKTMKETAAYREAYKKTMEGWQNKAVPMGEQGLQQYVVTEIMDTDSARILGPEGREKLMKELKVDAIVNLNIYSWLEGMSVMGIGQKKPQSRVFIEAYSRGTEERIWGEQIDGEKSDESVGMTGMFDEQKMAALALKSAESAYNKIGNN